MTGWSAGGAHDRPEKIMKFIDNHNKGNLCEEIRTYGPSCAALTSLISGHYRSRGFALLMIALWLTTGGSLSGQVIEWPAEAEERLKAIYERREFRGRGFNGEWLPDSSGYLVRKSGTGSDPAAVMRYDILSGEGTEVTGEELAGVDAERGISPDGMFLVGIDDDGIFMRHVKTRTKTQLIKNQGVEGIYYRNPVWSPDGKRVLFEVSDESHFRKRAMLMPTDPTYPEVIELRYARVGEKIARLRVGVVEVESLETAWLPIPGDDEEFYLGQVEWAGNSKEVLIEKLSRFRDIREFLLVDVEDREVQRIYREKNDAWAISSQGKNLGLNWIRNGEAFVVVTEKDGWRHAWLYSRNGGEEALLTPGEYDIIDKAFIDEPGGWYYFYASPYDATQRYLYRVPLDGTGKLERISPENQPGWHDYRESPDCRWAFHTYSTLNKPPVTRLVELPDHRVLRVLEDNHELASVAAKIISRPTEFLRLDVGNGIEFDACLTKPGDFDASKKYPVFIYVYGEPHGQTVLDRWGAGQTDFHRVIAGLGYLVVSIDNRGTPAPKGAAWRRSIFGSLGPLSTEDQAAGLKALARQCPFVDLSRVAIWGWSGGGSNTLNAMFRKPDIYHVGIAVVPKPQPHLYNAWFQEIYMRTPEVNPDGYEQSAPLNFAEGLKGKLLMITGSGETNTHIQIIEGLVDKLIELGKPFDYMVYPNRNHGLSEGAGSLVHVRMLIARYLVENLPPGPR
jgi:dipeptidyl-peptidase-4